MTGHTYRVYSVAFAPDGKQLASAGDHTARIWDIQSGQNVKTFTLESEILSGQPGVRASVSVVAYRPDGRKLAAGSTLGTVHLVSPNTGATLHTLTSPAASPPR